ncbi:MAG TPA: zinc-dependent metalloprotease [Puia sp.]|jgi:hypothetical protein|nr:zinc-dependent metalloprotease [Puia sp.]
MRAPLPTIIILSLLSLAGTANAQRPTGEGATRNGDARPAATIASITQNLKRSDGFYPFYYDDKSGKIYLEIDRWGEEFLYFSSLPEGVGNGGSERGQASAVIAKFIKVGPKVLLLQPDYQHRAVTGSADEKRDVADAFSQSVLFGFSPAALEGDKALVDLTPFVVRDALHIGENIGSGRGNPGSAFAAAAAGGRGAAPSGGSYRLDDSRSAVYIDNTRNFPKNTEFEALVTFTENGGGAGGRRGGVAPDPSAVTVRIHQAFVQLPDSGYRPRMFDIRSGFIPFSYYDFSAPMTEPLEKRFIIRHRLQKKDPNAAVSEPVEPIVYYIDRGAPPLIRKALIEGGSWWNQAFEAAGFKNAFIVKELPEGADPMDIRYNMVNWLDRSGSPQRAFSYGAGYVDPRTGEIIKGVVTLGSDRHREDYLIAEGLLQPYTDEPDGGSAAGGRNAGTSGGRSAGTRSGRSAETPVDPRMQEVALARIRQLSAHEIGHTLGLEHNFMASIKDRASVMDYPFPRFALKEDGSIDVSQAYATGIGSWDKRAIIWGYSDFPPGTDEDVALEKIMKETLKEGFKYIPDVGGLAHPLSNQWDDGVNPVDQLNKLMAVRRHLLDNFSEKAIPKGAPMATLQEVLVPIYLLQRYQVEAAAKSLGGLYFTHAVKNDGQEPTKMVEPAEQWRAFDALIATITPEALELPEALIRNIPPRPTGYPATVEVFHGHTGPTFDPMAAAEAAADNTLSYLLDAERAARLIEYQARDQHQPGLMAVLDSLVAQTWKAPVRAGYRGELQLLVDNLVLNRMLALAADPRHADNVRAEDLAAVDELRDWMQSQLSGATGKWKGELLFGLEQIGEFNKEPDKFVIQPAVEMPPGAPIGMPGMDW